MNDRPAWLTGILKKRSLLALRIILELIEVGLRQGEVSANDITVVYTKDEANTVGACFKILPRFGFVHTDKRVRTETRKKHGRRVDVWELREGWKAQDYVNDIKMVILDRQDELPTQQEMKI